MPAAAPLQGCGGQAEGLWERVAGAAVVRGGPCKTCPRAPFPHPPHTQQRTGLDCRRRDAPPSGHKRRPREGSTGTQALATSGRGKGTGGTRQKRATCRGAETLGRAQKGIQKGRASRGWNKKIFVEAAKGRAVVFGGGEGEGWLGRGVKPTRDWTRPSNPTHRPPHPHPSVVRHPKDTDVGSGGGEGGHSNARIETSSSDPLAIHVMMTGTVDIRYMGPWGGRRRKEGMDRAK